LEIRDFSNIKQFLNKKIRIFTENNILFTNILQQFFQKFNIFFWAKELSKQGILIPFFVPKVYSFPSDLYFATAQWDFKK